MRSNIATALKSTPVFRSIVVLCVALLLLTVACLMWLPAYLGSEEYGRELVGLNNEVQRLGLDVSMRKAVLEGGNSVSDIIVKINQDVTQTSLVTELNKIVALTGVSIAEQTFREVVEEDNIKQHKQLLHVSGEYKEIRYFISQVQEKLNGLNVIERIVLSQGKNDSRVDARIEMVTYTVSGQ